MRIKDFMDMIDLEVLNNQQINIIIHLKDRFENPKFGNIVIGDCEIDDKEKIVFDCSEFALVESDLYYQYGIEPTLKLYSNDTLYEIVDVVNSKDNYRYIYNEYGEVWVVVN